MTNFEPDYRKFELPPQRHQISTICNCTIEEVCETLETEDVEMSTYHSIIETIINRNFVNKFHHQNGPNKRQHIHLKKVNSINPYHIKDQGNHKLHT